jgi:hypothetical protein
MTTYLYLLIRAIITGRIILLHYTYLCTNKERYHGVLPRIEHLMSYDYDSKCEISTQWPGMPHCT